MSALDSNAPVTLQYQLKNLLICNIKDHTWSPNEKMPSEREICEQYCVSRTTVREVLKELDRDGYLVRKQGKGTFVKVPAMEQNLTKFYSFSEELQANHLKASTQILRFEILPSNSVLAEKLSINAGDLVYEISRLRLADDHPFAFEKSFIPYERIPGISAASVKENGLYKTINACSGLIANNATEEFDAINSTEEVGRLLKVPPKTALLKLARTTRAKETVIEYCISFVRSDRYKYKVMLK